MLLEFDEDQHWRNGIQVGERSAVCAKAGQGGRVDARRRCRAPGDDDAAAVSVLKLLGSEAELRATQHALEAAGSDGLLHPAMTGQYAPMNLDHYFASWFERYARSFSGTIAGGTSEIQRNIIAQRVLGLPRD